MVIVKRQELKGCKSCYSQQTGNTRDAKYALNRHKPRHIRNAKAAMSRKNYNGYKICYSQKTSNKGNAKYALNRHKTRHTSNATDAVVTKLSLHG